MMADAPETERLAKVERDVAWIKLIGSAMAVALGAIFWQLYSLNATVAAMDARLDGMNSKLDAMAATLAVIAGN